MQPTNEPVNPVDRSISIIHGTNRTQDLIPAFIEAVREVAPAEYEALIAAPFSRLPAYAAEDDTDPWWYGDEARAFVDELSDVLDAHAPEGCYFGAHPGDGSDFGFWLYEEKI